MKRILTLVLASIFSSLAFSQTNYYIDYDAYDLLQANNAGQNYQRFIWTLNDTSLPQSLNSRWLVVDFDELIVTQDGSNFLTLPNSGNYDIILDSVQVYYNFQPTLNNGNLVTFEVFNYDDIDRNQFNAPIEGANPIPASSTPVFSDSLTENELVTGANLQIATFFPGDTFSNGDKFSIYLTNNSDTADAFSFLAGYKENCSDQELGLNSEVPLNTVTNTFVGVNGFINPQFYDFGQNFNCPAFYTQNAVVIPYITFVPKDFFAQAISNQLVSETCPGTTFQLESFVAGGSGNYRYSWSPSTGLNDSTLANPSVTVGNNNQLYTLIVEDIDSSSFDTSTVEVLSFPINVNAGNDVTIGCADTTNINGFASPSGTGIQIEDRTWSGNRSNPLQVSTPGQYIFTATNNVGCSASDTVNVTVNGYNALNFELPNQVCTGTSSTFTNTSSNSSSAWSFNWTLIKDGTPVGTPQLTTDYTNVFDEAGNYSLVLQADSAECTFSRSRQFTVQVCSGIEDVINGEFVEVFPNPSTGVFSLDLRDVMSNNNTITVTDLNGKQVFNQERVAGNSVFNLNLNSVAEGIYLLQVTTEETTLINKLQITK